MEVFAQIVGWVGTFLIIVAYALVSYRVVEGSNKYYQLINLFGALGVGINVFYQHAWPAVALQAIWGLIAVITLVKNARV